MNQEIKKEKHLPGTFFDVVSPGRLPPGWKWTDGSQLRVADFPELFSAVRYHYGGKGGFFNLPDYRNKHRQVSTMIKT